MMCGNVVSIGADSIGSEGQRRDNAWQNILPAGMCLVVSIMVMGPGKSHLLQP
jgi:hypothetical protein